MTQDQDRKKKEKPAFKKPAKIDRGNKRARSNEEKKDPRPKQVRDQDEKLKTASAERRKGAYPKKKRTVSEKEKRINRASADDKKSRKETHIERKTAGREDLAKQKAGLEQEVKALNKLAEVRETVDSQYTAKFSGFESAIAAGPRGATSTGLRKLDPSMAINLARAEIGARIRTKLDPKVQMQIAKIGKIARDIKAATIKDSKETKVVEKVASDVKSAEQKIVNSKLRAKLKEMKARERMRDPNRNPSKFDEVNLPPKGVGGFGGMM